MKITRLEWKLGLWKSVNIVLWSELDSFFWDALYVLWQSRLSSLVLFSPSSRSRFTSILKKSHFEIDSFQWFIHKSIADDLLFDWSFKKKQTLTTKQISIFSFTQRLFYFFGLFLTGRKCNYWTKRATILRGIVTLQFFLYNKYCCQSHSFKAFL